MRRFASEKRAVTLTRTVYEIRHNRQPAAKATGTTVPAKPPRVEPGGALQTFTPATRRDYTTSTEGVNYRGQPEVSGHEKGSLGERDVSALGRRRSGPTFVVGPRRATGRDLPLRPDHRPGYPPLHLLLWRELASWGACGGLLRHSAQRRKGTPHDLLHLGHHPQAAPHRHRGRSQDDLQPLRRRRRGGAHPHALGDIISAGPE
jgi:hypothetical protein